MIAVNRAALGYRCDVWAALDAPLVMSIAEHVGTRPILLTSPPVPGTLADHGKRWRGRYLTTDDVERPPVGQWDTFTALAALVFAVRDGAKSIKVYGADWSGVADFDGVDAGGNRSPDRWTLERNLWTHRLVPWAAGLGVEVERVGA